MSRVVLNLFGSLGDLHPFLAVASELRRRRQDAVIATSEFYRQKITAKGVGFAPVRPDSNELAKDEALMRRIWDPRRGARS
jgi:UDP:flavonoid glycosyltransferase YjiC (YdhE family)